MKTFNYYYSETKNEYEIYKGDEIFCHLSETDFEVFMKLCRDGGYLLLRRI